MFERFSDRARKVMALANREALAMGHEFLGTEHILLGLIKEGTAVASRVLESLGVDLALVKQEIYRLFRSDEIGGGGQGRLPNSPRAKNVIELAIDEARALGHHFVGSEHLLLGILKDREGTAGNILRRMGVELDAARRAAVALGELSSGYLPNDPMTSTENGAMPGADVLEGLLRDIVRNFDSEVRELDRTKETCISLSEFDRAASLRAEINTAVNTRIAAILRILGVTE